MENNDYDPLNNPLVNYDSIDEINVGKDPIVQQFINKFPVDDNKKGLISYTEKISVLKNGEWAYDTYIRSNNDIIKETVIEYINKLEKNEYEVQDISQEFYGGPPMGTQMYDIHEINGDNVWVVNLKVNLYSYLKKKGNVGNLEELYVQVGGIREELKQYIHKDLLPKDTTSINSIIVDTINKMFFIDDNIDNIVEENKHYDLLNDTKQVHTHYDGNEYYTILNVYKDGKFLEKRKISSFRNPIDWQFILSEILKLNKHHKYYGYAYKLSNSWNKGYILETTNDIRYKVKYDSNE
jgi:hypothetical protein